MSVGKNKCKEEYSHVQNMFVMAYFHSEQNQEVLNVYVRAEDNTEINFL